jgi:hypothetical protein
MEERSKEAAPSCKLFAEFAGAAGLSLSVLHDMGTQRGGLVHGGGIGILCQRCVLTSGCRLRNRRICQGYVHSRHGHGDATDDPMQMQLSSGGSSVLDETETAGCSCAGTGAGDRPRHGVNSVTKDSVSSPGEQSFNNWGRNSYGCWAKCDLYHGLLPAVCTRRIYVFTTVYFPFLFT